MAEPTPTDWQREHLRALEERLAPLRALPDGPVERFDTPLHQIEIRKQEGQLLFFFRDRSSGELAGPMSRLDLARPLLLLAPYTQAALLTLAWHPEPRRVCLLGLAGGRVSLVLYHTLPQTILYNVDIDPAVSTIAERFFGLRFDQRQRLAVQDARRYLEQGDPGAQFEIVLMDAFRDDSDNLEHLATLEFYQRCRARLARGGVVCVNLLKSDPRFWSKARTFQRSFRHTLVCGLKRAALLFGSDRQLTPAELRRRAADTQRRLGLPFGLEEHAARCGGYRELERYDEAVWRSAPILRDGDT
jgi:spermidine synthase